MQIQNTNINSKIIDELAASIGITKEQYNEAVDKYNKLALDLEDALNDSISIYTQGSFMIGTVIKPYKNGKDADYDIDLVCECINKTQDDITPKDLKRNIGIAIRSNTYYNAILDKEGKRCWTLKFHDFHMDCLPCIPFSDDENGILLTNTEDFINYNWKKSNPRKFAGWFRERQKIIESSTRKNIFENNKRIYNSIEDVPDICVKTPLQKVIQILKRHRDVYFTNKINEKYKPISMIITVLSAEIYQQEADSYLTLKNIVEGMSKYEDIYKNNNCKYCIQDDALIKFDGTNWIITNPVAKEENFAERWHEDNHARANAFFEWVRNLKNEFLPELESNDFKTVRNSIETNLKQFLNESKYLEMGFLNTNTDTAFETLPPVRNIVLTNPIKPYKAY